MEDGVKPGAVARGEGAAPGSGPAADGPRGAEALRVLVVDDEDGMRLGAARVIERFRVSLPSLEAEVPFAVDTAATGEEALEKIARSPPEILLLDHKLPGLSGLDVLDRVVADGRDVLTVMVTAYASLEAAVMATRHGAFDFLAKPFTPSELRQTLTKAARQVALQRQAKAHAEEKRRLRFEFVSVLAHELKAPLAAVEGYLLSMKDRSLGDSLEAYAKSVERSLARLEGMRKLVEDLLDLTRIESGQKKRELERLDLREVARASLDLVRQEAERRGIALELKADGAVCLLADRGEMELLLNNLLTNAVKYNRDGGRVEVALSQDGAAVRLRVSDTGIGMTAEESARVFHEFVRIKNEKTRRIAGSGLGLSTVHKVVQLYRGEITVQSTPGEGSHFRVALPADPPPGARGSPQSQERLRGGAPDAVQSGVPGPPRGA